MPNSASPRFSDRSRSVWAKSFKDPKQSLELTGWLPLYQHLDDAAGIASLLWDQWAPLSIKDTLSQTFGGETSARSLLVWLAATHDVGKASPAFAVQVEELARRMSDAGLHMDQRIAGSDERRGARHELVSFLAIRAWLEHEHGFDRQQAARVASIAAAHHGRPAGYADIMQVIDSTHLIGGDAWETTRREFLNDATSRYLDEETIDAWRTASITQPSLVLLSSLVIVADWISSSDLFTPAELGKEPTDATDVRVSEAWQKLDFPHPWKPNPDAVDAASFLIQRFDLPPDATPHPTQVAFIDKALQLERPELMILEAEMGSGKTEAALLAAEILAGKFGASGIFVGLPTQATADGMFSRVLTWAQHLDLDIPSNIFLARGRAELNPAYERLAREAYFRSIGQDRRDEHEDVIAHHWFSNPRRGPLSNFVVGTVDQALFAGLRSRYLMLRHLALASKVVIIDEVHAYDEYMREFLKRVLEWLGTYDVPVILLSATLPSSHRGDYLSAYDRGREARKAQPADAGMTASERKAARRARIAAEETRYAGVSGLIGYPAITVSSPRSTPIVTTPASSRASRDIHIEQMDDDDQTLVDTMRNALRDGGNVAVIRNTVRRAQETAALLRGEFPDVDVALAHSRFLGLDRAAKDRSLLDHYGRGGQRPQMSIVVATQVIEQSLDIDFDLMITDIAPIDLILQRSGRLHRHDRDRPAPLRLPRIMFTGVDETAGVPEFEKGSEVIYSRALLLRTFATVRDRDRIIVPDEIGPLIETVYGDDDGFVPDAWREALAEAEREHQRTITDRQRRASSFTLDHVTADADLIGWINGPDVDPELSPPGRGTVRDGEETLEVIVLQRDTAGTLRTPSWLPEGGGLQIPENEAPNHPLTRTILGCFLRMPAGMCRGTALDRHIETLERSFDLPSWHTSHALKGELVLVLDAEGRGTLNEFDLRYSAEDGFEYSRREA